MTRCRGENRGSGRRNAATLWTIALSASRSPLDGAILISFLVSCRACIVLTDLPASRYQINRCSKPPDGLNGASCCDRIRQTQRQHEDCSGCRKADCKNERAI